MKLDSFNIFLTEIHNSDQFYPVTIRICFIKCNFQTFIMTFSMYVIKKTINLSTFNCIVYYYFLQFIFYLSLLQFIQTILQYILQYINVLEPGLKRHIVPGGRFAKTETCLKSFFFRPYFGLRFCLSIFYCTRKIQNIFLSISYSNSCLFYLLILAYNSKKNLHFSD